jgi:hypothetical protein
MTRNVEDILIQIIRQKIVLVIREKPARSVAVVRYKNEAVLAVIFGVSENGTEIERLVGAVARCVDRVLQIEISNVIALIGHEGAGNTIGILFDGKRVIVDVGLNTLGEILRVGKKGLSGIGIDVAASLSRECLVAQNRRNHQ